MKKIREDLNFLLTNRLPRRYATKFVGWLSGIEQPIVRSISMALWRAFCDVDLSDAKKTRFASMHDCFTRELRDGARPVDSRPDVVVSPCDGIVGACGRIEGTALIQAKGFPYQLADLLPHPGLVETFRGGRYVTLRLTAGMYHRFHAPHDIRFTEVTYISGDTWNVNPIALARIEKLFCKNERAVLAGHLGRGDVSIALVPVAAILVASIRLHFLDVLLHIGYRGPKRIECDATFRKGEELGWFQHGSTIIVFAPDGVSLCDGVREGSRIRMGQALLMLPG